MKLAEILSVMKKGSFAVKDIKSFEDISLDSMSEIEYKNYINSHEVIEIGLDSIDDWYYQIAIYVDDKDIDLFINHLKKCCNMHNMYHGTIEYKLNKKRDAKWYSQKFNFKNNELIREEDSFSFDFIYCKYDELKVTITNEGLHVTFDYWNNTGG